MSLIYPSTLFAFNFNKLWENTLNGNFDKWSLSMFSKVFALEIFYSIFLKSEINPDLNYYKSSKISVSI